MRIERSVHIARSPEDVFSYIADARNDPAWCPRVLASEPIAGDGPGPDARYRVTHRPVRVRQPMELDVRVVGWDPPRRIELREEDEDGVFEVTYELTAVGDGTRLVQRDEVSLSLPRFLWPVARFNIGRHLNEQFESLKAILERS